MAVEKKLKSSKQRDLVLRILRTTESHPTADWIYQQARHEMPNISLGTVYRNLNLLKEEGRIRALTYGSGTTRYDADLRDHYHIRCLGCGKVGDLPHDLPRACSTDVAAMTGYEIHGHRLEFTGICPQCREA
jgi:Fur family peroxide stress response transcriptional regulator